jgi:hypothetical protein
VALDQPYIIWAMRRTGGTTFASFLGRITSHTSVQHEPFNPERLYGEVAKDWNESYDLDRMRAKISNILQSRPVIKHCYEIAPLPLNILLLQESVRLGYHTILLHRKAEVDRQFSLEIAKLTGAWGAATAGSIYEEIRSGARPKPVLPIRSSVAHMADCHMRKAWLASMLSALGIDYSDVAFEDLYADREQGVRTVNAVLARLGHADARIAELRPDVELAVTAKGQDTQRIDYLVENAVKWRQTMQSIWDLLQSGGVDPSARLP